MAPGTPWTVKLWNVKWHKQKAWPFSAISPELPHGPAILSFRPKGIKSVFTLMRMATLFRIAKVETPEGIQSERQLYGTAGSNGRGLLWRNVTPREEGGGHSAGSLGLRRDRKAWLGNFWGPSLRPLGIRGSQFRGGRHSSLGRCCEYTLLINKSDLITEFPPSIPPWSPAGGTTILRVVRHSPALREGSLWSSQAVKNHSHPAPGFYWATYLQKRPRLLDQLAWYNWLSDWIPQQETPEDIKKKLSIGLSVGHE